MYCFVVGLSSEPLQVPHQIPLHPGQPAQPPEPDRPGTMSPPKPPANWQNKAAVVIPYNLLGKDKKTIFYLRANSMIFPKLIYGRN
jgi:hypothetical protein